MPYIRTDKYKIPRSKVLKNSAAINGSKHLIVHSGNKYTGEWKNNLRHGYGNYETTSKKVYEGYWSNGLQQNYGVKSHKDDKNVNILEYRGNWSNGVRNGYGEKKNKDHSFYKGGFKDGKKHGYGQMWFADGTFYDGDWMNGFMHGKGLRTYVGGKRYDGNFVRGFKEGKGSYVSLRTGIILIGIWYKDICISSCMGDIQMKQSAAYPNKFPLPKCELEDYKRVHEDQVNNAILLLRDPYDEVMITQNKESGSFKKHDNIY